VEVGTERQALVAVADKLCAELGYAGEDRLDDGRAPVFGEPLGPEAEQLIATLRASLARIAVAAGGGTIEDAAETAVRALLGGAVLVMRRELMLGKSGQLGELLPSFVFLVTLPLVEHCEAQQLADRTSSLLGEMLA
jgi:hypothetical protein